VATLGDTLRELGLKSVARHVEVPLSDETVRVLQDRADGSIGSIREHG
jgi:hypothetical protein